MSHWKLLFKLSSFSKHITTKASHLVTNRCISTLNCPCTILSSQEFLHSSISKYSQWMYSKSSTSKSGPDEKDDGSTLVESNENMKSSISKSLEADYIPFANQQRVIQDVIEEVWDPLLDEEEEVSEIPEHIRRRGKTGVFDLGELVEILEEENAREVCVMRIPQELDYADYMVIVTARNAKHMHALAKFVRKRFKLKDRKKSDVIPRIEGTENSTDWLALDLSNIVLHIFTWRAREHMDLETLWTVGIKFDDLYNQPDSDIVALLNSIK